MASLSHPRWPTEEQTIIIIIILTPPKLIRMPPKVHTCWVATYTDYSDKRKRIKLCAIVSKTNVLLVKDFMVKSIILIALLVQMLDACDDHWLYQLYSSNNTNILNFKIYLWWYNLKWNWNWKTVRIIGAMSTSTMLCNHFRNTPGHRNHIKLQALHSIIINIIHHSWLACICCNLQNWFKILIMSWVTDYEL